jgi:hypothetical protein
MKVGMQSGSRLKAGLQYGEPERTGVSALRSQEALA